MTTNNVLTAVALVENGVRQIQAGKRVQIDRQTLLSISSACAQALNNLTNAGFTDDIVLSYLLGCVELIKSAIEMEDYKETDTMMKIAVEEKLCPALQRLYLKAGEYYEKNDFNYSPRLGKLLERIVDRCVEDGYYFGVDKDVVQGEV